MSEWAPMGRDDVWGWTRSGHVLASLGVLAFLTPLVLVSNSSTSTRQPMPALRIDPSTAPEGVLLSLPTMGRTRVTALVAARRAQPFRTSGDLARRVKGIGPATIAVLEPHLRFPTKPELVTAKRSDTRH